MQPAASPRKQSEDKLNRLDDFDNPMPQEEDLSCLTRFWFQVQPAVGRGRPGGRRKPQAPEEFFRAMRSFSLRRADASMGWSSRCNRIYLMG
jgi:hypothetical protein